MSQLSQRFAERFRAGLQRKAVMDAATWAERYRVMGKPYPGKYSFLHHPWARDMHNSKAPMNVGKKSAQMGYTEAVLNLALFNLDIPKNSVLYVLPNKMPDSSDFSNSRFDPALELSPHIREIFSDTKNVGLKRSGSASLFIRGSNSRPQLKSLPIAFLVLDELDEMEQKHIPLVLERLSGQLEEDRTVWMVSTPTVPGVGIDFYYEDTSDEHWVFPCPACSKLIELKFPESLEIIGETANDPRTSETYIKCTECKAKLNHEDKITFLNKGKWVANKSSSARGFYINQMYSMNLQPSVLAVSYLAGLTNQHDEQEFWNSKLGLAHTVEGASVEDHHLDKLYADYSLMDMFKGGLNTMGVDVGKVLNIWINNWDISGGLVGTDINMMAKARNLYHSESHDWNLLDKLMEDFSITYAVVDCQPETAKAKEFADKWYGRVKLCRYVEGITGKKFRKSEDDDDLIIQVDRTA